MVELSAYPVDASLSVRDAVDIYRKEEWWKAAVKYALHGDDDEVVAIYLWHREDGEEWKQKQKYTIKNADSWLMDRQLVESYLPESALTPNRDHEFPVSDYYRVLADETVFKTEEWWKAIVAIDRKGSYDTHEVIIYLWQYQSGKWRRRQKYPVKRATDWAEDRIAVERLLSIEPDQATTTSSTEPSGSAIIGIAKDLGIEVEGDDLTTLYEELERTHLAAQSPQ